MRDRKEMEVELGDSLPPQHKQASKYSQSRGAIAADKQRDWDRCRQRKEEERPRNCPPRPILGTALYPINFLR